MCIEKQKNSLVLTLNEMQVGSRSSSPSSTISYWEFREETPNYWEYIEDSLRDIEEKMEAESFYINESVYNMLNVKVRVGLSAICNFTPCVKIICVNNNVTFDNIQWYDFIDKLVQQFSTNKFNSSFEFNIDQYNISFNKDNMLKIETIGNIAIQLTKEQMEELLNLQNLINFRLLYLDSLKFLDFYQNALLNATFVKQTCCISEDCISIIKCNILSSLILTPQCCSMLECVNLLKDKIITDLDKYKTV